MSDGSLLFLTPQPPYPLHQGTAIRNFHLLRWLAGRYRVDLATFADAPFADDSPLWRFCDRIIAIQPPSRNTGQRIRTTLLSSMPDMALRLHSDGMAQAIHLLLEERSYDAIQIEGIEMAPYGFLAADWMREQGGRPRVIFDDHNAEYVLQQRAFLTDIRDPLRWPGAIYSLIQWQKLRRYERKVCLQADAVVAVSGQDADMLRKLDSAIGPIVVPNGVDMSRYERHQGEPESGLPALVFTGKMDFRPNVDAMTWFASAIWPRIRAKRSDVMLFIVGQKPHARVARLGHMAGITITGFVPEIRPYIARAHVYVVPIRMGGGTRLKVLQAMAMGKAIVSTSLGAEGIGAKDGREIVLADAPDTFANAVLDLLESPERRRNLGEAARSFVRERFDWSVVAPGLAKAHEWKRRP